MTRHPSDALVAKPASDVAGDPDSKERAAIVGDFAEALRQLDGGAR